MYTGQQITGKKAQQLVDKGAVIYDTRDPVKYRDGTIPGAINLTLRKVSDVLKHPKTTPIIVFGDDASTVKSTINYISQYGFSNVFLLNSIDDWNK